MRARILRSVSLWLLLASMGVLACDLSAMVGAVASKPTTTIQAPAGGSIFREGEDINIRSTSTDPNGIVRVELSVDGAVIRSDSTPQSQPQVSFTVLQQWNATAGVHTISVRAFNKSGAAGDPAFVSITVAAAPAASPTSLVVALNTPTPLGALATATAPAATATRPPTARPPASATPNVPPGVYASAIRVDPAAPKKAQFVTFHVTFLNTTGEPRAYAWRIRIFEPDKRNSFGDTAIVRNDIPVGTTTLASANNWRVTGLTDCQPYIARVFAVNTETKEETEFSKPDRTGGPAAGFQVCP